MNKNIFSFISGFVFSIGLGIGGMMSPFKVKNFLDLLGNWDPSLIFVMAGALIVSFIGYRLVWKKKTPLCENKFYLPTKTKIEKSLMIGAILFGIGWGLLGICPGPALANLSLGSSSIFTFLLAMYAGFFIVGLFNKSTS